jgi:hypothetical protein
LNQTTGDRLIYCRGLIGFDRKDLLNAIGNGTSSSSLARWELNQTAIPKSKLKLLVDTFLEHNIRVSIDWLKSGIGVPPINLNLQNLRHLNFDDLTYPILFKLHQNIKDFHFKQVNNNFFSPIVSYGDYVAGVNTDPKLLDNKFCFMIDKNVTVGNFSFTEMSLKNINNEYIYIENIETVILGEIIWIARRP